MAQMVASGKLYNGAASFARHHGSLWVTEYWLTNHPGSPLYSWGTDSGLVVLAGGNTNIARHLTLPLTGTTSGSAKSLPATINTRHISGLSSTLIWIAHQTGVLKYNSGTDQYDSVHTWSSTTRARICPITETNIWAVTDTEVWHYNGGSWSDRTSELSGSPVAFKDVRAVGTTVYVLAHDSTPDTQIHRYDGSWTMPHSSFGTNILHIAMWVWSDDEICLARHYTGNWRVYSQIWNGATWDGYTLYTRDSYTWGDNYVEDIYSPAPGEYYVGTRNATAFGPSGHVFEFHNGEWHWIDSESNIGVFSLSAATEDHLGANIREDTRGSDGRYLITNMEIADVKLINPSTDPGFGETSHGTYHGAGWDGAFKVGGQKTIPGGSISFGTVAGGVNTLAWHNWRDGPPYGIATGSGAPDPNTTYDISIPTDNVLKLAMTQSAGAATSWIGLASEGRWLLPGATDFALTVDVDLPTLNWPNCYLYLMFSLGLNGDLRANNPYVPPTAEDYQYQENNTYYQTLIRMYGSEAGPVQEYRYTENSTNTWGSIPMTSGAPASSGYKLRMVRSGNDLTLEAYDANGSAWVGTTKTMGAAYGGTHASAPLIRASPLSVYFQVYCAVSGGKLTDVDSRSTISLTGTSAVNYSDAMNLWTAFDWDQGEQVGLPAEPTALVLDQRSVSFIDLVNNRMAWRAARTTTVNNKPFGEFDHHRIPYYPFVRMDYHDGLLMCIVKDGTAAQTRATGCWFALIDFSTGEARRFVPGDDSATGYSGYILGIEIGKDKTINAYDYNKKSFLGTEYRGAKQVSGVTNRGQFSPTSDSLVWRCVAGNPRAGAVYRDTDCYAYYVGASEGGIWVTRHRTFYEKPSAAYDTNAAHVTTYNTEVIAVEIDKGTGNMFWLTAAGAFYYAAKATWQAMGETTPNASYYVNGFTHDATTTFSGTLSRLSQERIAVDGTTAYIAADEGVYRSVAGGSFSLLYGDSGSGAANKILPDLTAVDVISFSGEYLTALCYDSVSGDTTCVVINTTSNVTENTQVVTDEVGGSGKRATALGTGLF